MFQTEKPQKKIKDREGHEVGGQASLYDAECHQNTWAELITVTAPARTWQLSNLTVILPGERSGHPCSAPGDVPLSVDLHRPWLRGWEPLAHEPPWSPLSWALERQLFIPGATLPSQPTSFWCNLGTLRMAFGGQTARSRAL